MSAIFEKLTNDIKGAMIEKNNVKRDCLRCIVSEIKNQTVNAGKEITDDVCIKVIQKSAKQHNDSIDNFKSGNREDLAQKEIEELKYISEYLPKLMSESETVDVINTLLKTIEPVKKNMGVIMKQLPKEVDRKLASQILNKILN